LSKYLYIVNPTSGKGRGKKAIPLINSFCSSNNIDYAILETEYHLHARELAKNNCDKYDVIVAVGGDGTVNEIINGMEVGASTLLAVLPVGSGNDFVKNLGFGNNINDNMSIIHDSNFNEIASVDVGKISFTEVGSNNGNSHKFVNSLGIGFDAYVGHLNQKNKVLSGLLSYIYAVIRALFNYQMINVDIDNGNTQISGDKLLISIGNGISSGGGFYLNPFAKINDGLLDVTVVDKVTRRRLMTALPMALINKLEKVPEAKLSTTKNITLKLNTPYFAHCEGEIITEKLTSAVISIEKDSLRVLKKVGF
jgi:YegS/Rv2252/BmrU family lipid kinase